jgi:non-specific serine/threonine protein kinase
MRRIRIFKVFGTPTEETWPHVSELSEYKPNFPIYPATPLQNKLPSMDPIALDLLARFLQYQPNMRITAKEALNHVYFQDLRAHPEAFGLSAQTL